MHLFALYRERTGRSQLVLELDPGTTVGDVLLEMRKLYPGLAPVGVDIVTALNTEYARPEQEVAEGDEVALIPPVSGGKI